jgi:hypothetical protein
VAEEWEEKAAMEPQAPMALLAAAAVYTEMERQVSHQEDPLEEALAAAAYLATVVLPQEVDRKQEAEAEALSRLFLPLFPPTEMEVQHRVLPMAALEGDLALEELVEPMPLRMVKMVLLPQVVAKGEVEALLRLVV